MAEPEFDYFDALAGADPSKIEGLPWGSDPDAAMEKKREREEEKHCGVEQFG